MVTIFHNAQILTMTSTEPTLLRGAVGVVGSHIALVSDSAEALASFETSHPEATKIDCQGKLLMPGLINSHAHIPMSLQRGTGDDIELMEWLNDTVWPFEAMQSDEDIEAGARLGIAELLLGGTTTFVDMYWSEHYVAKAVEQMGIRAFLGESCLEGERMENFERNILPLIEHASGSELINAVIAPHAPYTCPPAIYKRCVELAEQYSLPLTTHLAETLDEQRTIEERYGMTPTEYLDSLGVLTPSTLLAHGVHLSESDIEIIRQRGAHVVHNPQCNMKISSGVAPVPALLAAGVSCVMGTDGVCSNNDVDMWDEMRTASFLHKLTTSSPTTLPAYKVLQMATVDAARALGAQGTLGVITEGALADLILMNINRVHYRPHHDIISSLVYCGKAADVEYVMVNGTMRVANYELLNCDLESICKDVESRSRAIFATMKHS